MNIDDVLEQTQWDTFWLPPDARVIDREEILYLRCSRDEGYLNTVLRVRAPSERLAGLIAEVRRAHAGVGSRWMLANKSRLPGLAEALSAAGYQVEHEHFAYFIDVHRYEPRPSPGLVARRVETLDDLKACQDVSARAFLRPKHHDAASDAQELKICTAPGARVLRYVVRDEGTGEPLASGGMNVYPSLRFGFLWAGGTIPEARRRGAYAALLAVRARDARALGLDRVGLYARVDSSAPIVEAHGFTRAGPMSYWYRAA